MMSYCGLAEGLLFVKNKKLGLLLLDFRRLYGTVTDATFISSTKNPFWTMSMAHFEQYTSCYLSLPFPSST